MNKTFYWPLMHEAITREDREVLIDYLKQDNPRLTNGPKVEEFEHAWNQWLGTKYSLMVNSGASANDLTMLALREKVGSGEIIVPPLTWVSDIASVLHAGFTPRFVDINPVTLGMDVHAILKAVTSKTKAVFLTHILGFNALTEQLITELKRLNIILIEDVCESHGTEHENKRVGNFGLASNFSFYFAHHMSTIEGGMISTDDPDFYETLRMMRSHGLVRESRNPKTAEHYRSNYPSLNQDFIFSYAAHNMRSTELNAIIGLSQIKRLDEAIEKRKRNFEYFVNGLNAEHFQTSFLMLGNSNYAFTIILNQPDMLIRDRIEGELTKHGIEFRRGLAGGGNQLRQPYAKNLVKDLDLNDFPVVEHIHHYSWYVGNYPDLELEKIDFLHKILKEVFSA
jgi:CDP-6-deoxy-D-xylo-4-hexulose-3-dehydrase